MVYFERNLSNASTTNSGLFCYEIRNYLDNTAGGTAGDYLASNGSLLWDASTNPTYQNDIIAVEMIILLCIKNSLKYYLTVL